MLGFCVLKFLLFRKHCSVLPPGWGLIQRRLSSLLVAILREWMRDSISPLFSPWEGCLVQNFVLKRLVILSGNRLNSLKSLQQLKQAIMASAGAQPDAATFLGLWLPGYFVIWVPGGSSISGALAWNPILVGQQAHSWWSDQLHGLQKRLGTSRLQLIWTALNVLFWNCDAFSY